MNYKECNFSETIIKPLIQINPPPAHLWYRGKLPEPKFEKGIVAIVGSRRATRYGEQIAYNLAYNLARLGVIIVSGLAYGIDACAHRGCLDAGGITIAVLGTSIDKIYPQSNASLAQRILEKGAIISEYPPGFETRNYHFLRRNRIVTGLSKTVVIVEAAERSGTLATAVFAEDQSRAVYAVPGNINALMSRGCNNMIGANKASIYVNFETFVQSALGISVTEPNYNNLTPQELSIIKQLQQGKRDGDQIVRSLNISVAVFNQTITMLEIKNLVRPLGCNQ